MLINDRYGMGHLLDPLIIDKWTLYKIGQYCDGLVTDGKGGTEPRFTCNLYLQVAAEAYKVMQDLASIFRGMSYWANSTVMVSADMPGDSVAVYTNASVIGGKFNYSGSAKKTRHTVALIGWSDPTDFYRGKIEPVVDDEGVERYGYQVLRATALGCTSQGMAARVGRWMLMVERLLTDTVSFDVGLDGTISAPGDYIEIADAYRAGKRIGGRVKTATTTVIVPDHLPPDTVAGDTLTVTLPNGIAQSRAISAIGSGAFTVAPPLDAAPLTDSAWGVASSVLNIQQYKVIAVTEAAEDSEEMTFSIVALQSNQDIFEAVETGFKIQVQDTSQIPIKAIPPPAEVTVTSFDVYGATITTTVAVSWTQVTGATRYDVQVKKEGGNWSPVVRVGVPHYELTGVTSGTYIARVSSVTATGIVSLPRVSVATPIVVPPPPELLIDEDTGEILFDELTSNTLEG
jgi:predicted phage tail protein